MRRRDLLIAAGLLVSAFAAPVFAQSSSIIVENAWAPPTPGASKTAAIYFTVENRGGAPDRIVGAETMAAEHADMHTTIRDGDIMRMRRVVSVEIPAGGKAVFAPNGFHVMLTGLKAPLKLGDTVPITLKFAEAGDMPVIATVRR